jgi:hypothetical protein
MLGTTPVDGTNPYNENVPLQGIKMNFDNLVIAHLNTVTEFSKD